MNRGFCLHGAMQPKSEELLYTLCWALTVMTQPTMGNMMSSYESWAYRNGLRRQVETMSKRGFFEGDGDSDDPKDRVYRLSALGRRHALGGRNPEECWEKPWDGLWRMVVFDIPERRAAERVRLRRHLHARVFGYLQNSVWISPHPLDLERSVLGGGKIRAESLVLLECRPAGGESDRDLVLAAWDFREITKRYRNLEEVLGESPRRPVKTESDAEELRDWWRREREAWLHAVSIDPLLPRSLWPADYIGEKVWKLRKNHLIRVAKLAKSFNPPGPTA
jgi:phenylacetic acid degradation operon negative regulatory protein